MTKIYLDDNGLKNYVNNYLGSAISLVNSSRNIAKSLSIPYDFDYRSYLKNLDDKLTEDLNELNRVYNKIKTHFDYYSYANNDLYEDLRGIENYSISLRQSAIK